MDINIQLYNRDGTGLGDMSEAKIRKLEKKIAEENFEFELAFDHPQVANIDLGLVEVGVFLNQDTDPYFYGPVWTRKGGGSDNMLHYTATDLSEYLKDRFIEDDLHYIGVDQHTIGWNLIQHTQAQLDGDLGFTSGFALSGKTRDRHWYVDERPNVWDLLNRFRRIIDGYDWYFKVYGDGRKEWVAEYPKRGSYNAQQVFEWGKNLANYTHEENGHTINDVIALGEGEGPDRLETRYTDTVARAARGVATAILPRDDDVSVPDTLLDRAQAYVERNKAPTRIIDVTIRNHVDTPILDLVPGDERPVKIERGYFSFAADFLITGIDLNPYNDTAKLTVEEL